MPLSGKDTAPDVSIITRAFRRSRFDSEIIRLAVPALGALAADPLVSLVDTAYIGRLGTTALAALAVAAAVFGVAFSLFNFLSYGTTPLVAREIGRGDADHAGRMAVAALALGGIIGLAAAVVLLGAPHAPLRVLGASDEIIDSAVTYLRIRSLALPAVLLVMVGHGIFRGALDTKTPFVIALALNGVNLVLDPVLIFLFDLGLAGAAWATVVAQWFGAVVFLVVLVRRHRVMGLSFARPQWSDAAELIGAGRRLIARTASLLLVFTAATAVAARIGEAALAAHQVAMQLFIFLSLVLDAVAIAAQAMLGAASGVGDPMGIRERADRLVGMGIAAGAGLAVVLIGAAPWLAGWFTPDPAVQSAIGSVYPQLILVQIIGGAVFAWDGIVIGVTDFGFAMVATVIPSVVTAAILIPLVPLGAPLAAVWWAIVVLMLLRAGFMTWWHGARLAPVH